MKPWREVAVPHHDVLEGTFLQSEFAADLTAVQGGKATREYQDAAAFFQRTFITEGMRLLLIQVAQRLNGKGGEPVIQLQTAFGGARVAGTQDNGTSKHYKSVATIPFTSTLAITEHGLFSASTSGTLWDHSVFAAINVVSGDSIQFTYDLTINDGG